MSTLALSELPKGKLARVVSISIDRPQALRMMEMGFVEGAEVEIVHEAPLGGDPVAVRVRGGLVALRRGEAAAVRVSF